MSLFLIILILFVVIWVLFVLPARKRRYQHEAMQDSVDVGDEIITAGGLHGTVVELIEDTARIEIAPSIVVTLDRRAIAAVAREIDDDEEPPELQEQEEPAPETSSEPR